jgi:Mn-dependent transcriptional regulator
MSGAIAMTPSLENYIDVLYELDGEHAQVRVTDLAQRLSIAKASVNQAVVSLVKLGYAIHDKYGPVRLTEKGAAYARELQKRHAVLKTFFSDILNVDADIADKDACIIEHVISQAIIAKLTDYLENHENLNLTVEQGSKGPAARQLITLDKLRPGISAKIIRIAVRGRLRQRIMDMGLLPGTDILVEKVAPLGDPVEVRVKGYTLALRGSEANSVIVEIIKTRN